MGDSKYAAEVLDHYLVNHPALFAEELKKNDGEQQNQKYSEQNSTESDKSTQMQIMKEAQKEPLDVNVREVLLVYARLEERRGHYAKALQLRRMYEQTRRNTNLIQQNDAQTDHFSKSEANSELSDWDLPSYFRMTKLNSASVKRRLKSFSYPNLSSLALFHPSTFADPQKLTPIPGVIDQKLEFLRTKSTQLSLNQNNDLSNRILNTAAHVSSSVSFPFKNAYSDILETEEEERQLQRLSSSQFSNVQTMSSALARISKDSHSSKIPVSQAQSSSASSDLVLPQHPTYPVFSTHPIFRSQVIPPLVTPSFISQQLPPLERIQKTLLTSLVLNGTAQAPLPRLLFFPLSPYSSSLTTDFKPFSPLADDSKDLPTESGTEIPPFLLPLMQRLPKSSSFSGFAPSPEMVLLCTLTF